MGRRLAQELIENGGLRLGKIDHLTLVDVAFPEEMRQDTRFECLAADIGEEATMENLLAKQPEVIFHLAAIVSGEAEKNFELGMRVNFQASLHLLEYCRKQAFRPRIVFASSCGVFGGDVAKVVTDDTAPTPRSSYGTQKAMVELLLNDYSRRGFVDARSVRLPTIAVRPGKPNAATSSFISSIIREPLNGKTAAYPVPAETAFWIQSPRRVIQNIMHAANIGENELGDNRIITLPGLTVSVQEMIDSLGRLTSPAVTKRVEYKPDAFLQSIVLTWPPHFDTPRANKLGFAGDASVEEIIKLYIEEEGLTQK